MRRLVGGEGRGWTFSLILNWSFGSCKSFHSLPLPLPLPLHLCLLLASFNTLLVVSTDSRICEKYSRRLTLSIPYTVRSTRSVCQDGSGCHSSSSVGDFQSQLHLDEEFPILAFESFSLILFAFHSILFHSIDVLSDESWREGLRDARTRNKFSLSTRIKTKDS